MLLYKPNAVLAIRSQSHFFYQCGFLVNGFQDSTITSDIPKYLFGRWDLNLGQKEVEIQPSCVRSPWTMVKNMLNIFFSIMGASKRRIDFNYDLFIKRSTSHYQNHGLSISKYVSTNSFRVHTLMRIFTISTLEQYAKVLTC